MTDRTFRPPTLPETKPGGTDPLELLEQLTAAQLAIIGAENALRAAAPTGRDYPKPGAFTAAAEEHGARLRALDLVKLELQKIRSHLRAQLEAQGGNQPGVSEAVLPDDDRPPTPDETMGMAWYNNLKPEERRRWLDEAEPPTAAAAWELFKAKTR